MIAVLTFVAQLVTIDGHGEVLCGAGAGRAIWCARCSDLDSPSRWRVAWRMADRATTTETQQNTRPGGVGHRCAGRAGNPVFAMNSPATRS